MGGERRQRHSDRSSNHPPTYNATFSWSLPGQISGSGGALSLSTTANDISNGAGIATQICVSGGFQIEGNAGNCARAYAQTPGATDGPHTASLTLLSSDASLGTRAVVSIGFGAGNVNYTYQVQPVGPPPPPSPPPPCPPGSARDLAHAAAPNEVRVVKVVPDAQFHKGGTPADAWLPLEPDTVLKAGDEVTTDPDGAVTVAFADNSTVVIRNTTQLKISSFFVEGGVVRTEILLKMGEVAACVNKSETTKSDFHISPTPEFAGVRGAHDAEVRSSAAAIGSYGTAFTAFYDPGSNTFLVSAQLGTVIVTPPNSGGRSVLVGAGREVELTPAFVSPVAPIGQAGARGGVDVRGARDLVLATVDKYNRACGAYTPRTNAFAVRPAPAGWTVSVKLIGRLHGTSLWRVTSQRVTPANVIARKLASGCH